MGCLLGCFRPRGGDGQGKNHLVSSSIPSARKIDQDRFVPKRRLGSLLLNEDHDPPSQLRCSGGKEIDEKDSLYCELKREAEFLKTCGALLQTPPEIRKTSARVTVQDPVNSGASSNFVSEISDSCKKILWDEKHELSRCPDLLKSNYESSSPEYRQVMQQCKCSSPSASLSKSLGFEGVQIESVIDPKFGCRTPDVSLFQHESHTRPFASRFSPFATPLMVEEMETPATVYPSNLENLGTTKKTMVPTQYAYPVLNPAENLNRKLLNEEDSLEPLQTHGSFDQRPEYIPDSREKTQQSSQISEPEDTEFSATPVLISPSDKRRQKAEIIYTDKYVSDKTSITLETTSKSRDEYPEHVVKSLSKKSSDANNGYYEIKDKPYSNKSSDTDRPILGMVAAHWKEEEPEHKSPKQWDGNGIPNSTNKYKEDQKVSWHATPFEERLEKALSEENFLPTRKFYYGKPLEFEGELADTAAS